MNQRLTSIRNNRKGNQVVHLTKSEAPKHNEYTLCGIMMKSQRWKMDTQLANCFTCLDMESMHTHVKVKINHDVLDSNG